MVNFSSIQEAWGPKSSAKRETFSQDNDINGVFETENGESLTFSDTETVTEVPQKYLKKNYSQNEFKRIFNKCKKYKNEIKKLKIPMSNNTFFDYVSDGLSDDKRQILVLVLIGTCVLIFMNLLKSLFN
jgi:hypothetical protein